MSAFDDRFLSEQGITDLQDISHYVPNVRLDQAGTFIQPRVRGFSTNTVVNRGLALPVGLVIDEIPYSRADYFAVGLFDVERVEVLRGPQGQLFGANTTVGLLNLTTKNPTDEFSGSLEASGGELGRRRYAAAIGGPLIPGWLNFRIAGLTDKRDGYVKNTTAKILPDAPEMLSARERDSFRGKLEMPDLFGGNILISYQRDNFEIRGEPEEFTYVPEPFREFMLQFDPNTDFEPDNFVASLDTNGFREAEIESLTATGSYDLAGWSLNFATGVSELESGVLDDVDSGPWKVTNVVVEEESRQKTAEIRIASPDLDGLFGLDNLFGISLGQTEFTAGLFFQRREQMPTRADTIIGVNMLLTLTAISEGAPVPPIPPPQKIEFFSINYDQVADEQAGFAQMSWQFLNRWTLIAGIRVSEIDNEASWLQVVGAEDPPSLLNTLGLIPEFEGAATDSERYTAPKVGLKFDWTESVNFYATWAEGFQPGGFNNFSTGDTLESRVVEPAFVESWEVGSKMQLFDGVAELNIGLFDMTMENFQLFTLSPPPQGQNLPVSQVLNVGELSARGVEADATWLVTDWLNLRGALGYNDSEYLDFPIGTCITDRPNTDGDDDPRCDLTGQQMHQAPKWDVSMATSVNLPLTSLPGLEQMQPSILDRINLTSVLSIQYTDDRFLHDSNDPRTLQPAFTVVNWGVGLANPTQGWSLQVRVENLTDERYHNTASEGSPASGVIKKQPLPGRHVYGSFSWEF